MVERCAFPINPVRRLSRRAALQTRQATLPHRLPWRSAAPCQRIDWEGAPFDYASKDVVTSSQPSRVPFRPTAGRRLRDGAFLRPCGRAHGPAGPPCDAVEVDVDFLYSLHPVDPLYMSIALYEQTAEALQHYSALQRSTASTASTALQHTTVYITLHHPSDPNNLLALPLWPAVWLG